MTKAKFILSKSKVLSQYNKVKEYADVVSYSSKTNQNVVKILEETNSMFSVHFVNELKHVNDKSRVMFIAQAWDSRLVKELIDMGIRWFIVDNEYDLQIMVDFLKNNDVKVNLLLRVKLKEHTIRTEKYFVFGMGSEVVNSRIKELRSNGKVDKLGIHFHRKTQNLSEWNLQYEVSNILSSEVLELIDVVNIGGGIPCVYANTNEDVIRTVFDKIKEFREWLNSKNIKMVIEPGRYIAAPAVKLVTSIIGVYEDNVIVNASVYNSDMDTIIVPVKLLVEGELDKKEGRAFIVKGSTPCSMDIFRYRVYLDNPKVGDELVFLNAGAYNFSSDFCDLEKLETEIVD
tara:strand:- start:274 stop:1305 length:1032 start_codon:yes stop_codon:yes gene_type:complete